MANETPDDGPEQRRMTTDPERIREWAQSHDAVPVTIRDSDDHGYSFARQGQLEADHEEYTWDEFIETLDNENLVFVYHEDDPSGEELGHFEIVEREAAFDRASLGRNELEDQLREGKTVTTEIVETQVVETEVVERDTIESEVVDTELAERRVVDSELLSRELVDTEFISDDIIEVVTDETRLETIEEIERYTIESQVVDVDIEQREELEHDEIETNIELESVQRSILESDVVRADVTADEVVDQEVIRSKRTEGDIVQSELIERRTIEEQIDERTQMRFTLEETELLESTVVSSDVLEGEIIDVEEYGATDTTAETEASAGTDTPPVDTGPVELSSDDHGKDVVDETGQQIGIVAEVEGQTAYIDPEPGLTDRLRARLNWGGHGDDDYPVDSSEINQITDDEVIIESDAE
ncbi:hypothetical protein [Natronorubrum bangense]|uniref:DUF2382 domain-containing protein n=2 Tax=Natronorubrum bangense TaxID=61858 RepID=L9WFH0_9EURY|nr:hypothetical protein [Natronorubrum bangense]ELY48011.1 hypothetical protein C494_12455 [Natronorubrum bangense JCM 10635]QCC53530.1 hypothetical protein DV706_02955 [Natronorubrum bangense]